MKLNEAAPAETVKAEIPAAETTPAVQAAPAEMPAAETPAAETPAANEEVKLAAIAETPPPATSAASTEPAPVAEAPSLEGNLAAMKIATLGGPAVTIEEPASAKPASRETRAQRQPEAGAARQGAPAHRGARDARCRRGRRRPASGRPVRATDRAQQIIKRAPFRSGRSQPAARPACPIRSMSRHTARCRARRGDKAPASAPARRRRSRNSSRSARRA